jgi:hypothetical protein
MRVEADIVESYPDVAVHFEGEEPFGRNPGWPRLDLSEQDMDALRRARDGWYAWRRCLLDLLEPGGEHSAEHG